MDGVGMTGFSYSGSQFWHQGCLMDHAATISHKLPLSETDLCGGDFNKIFA
jgi:hypothetical protein